MIFIERDAPHTRNEVEQKLSILRAAIAEFDNGNREEVKRAIVEVVPTFREPKEINDASADAEEMKQTVSV